MEFSSGIASGGGCAPKGNLPMMQEMTMARTPAPSSTLEREEMPAQEMAAQMASATIAFVIRETGTNLEHTHGSAVDSDEGTDERDLFDSYAQGEGARLEKKQCFESGGGSGEAALILSKRSAGVSSESGSDDDEGPLVCATSRTVLLTADSEDDASDASEADVGGCAGEMHKRNPPSEVVGAWLKLFQMMSGSWQAMELCVSTPYIELQVILFEELSLIFCSAPHIGVLKNCLHQ
jgi:hypothetical protein